MLLVRVFIWAGVLVVFYNNFLTRPHSLALILSHPFHCLHARRWYAGFFWWFCFLLLRLGTVVCCCTINEILLMPVNWKYNKSFNQHSDARRYQIKFRFPNTLSLHYSFHLLVNKWFFDWSSSAQTQEMCEFLILKNSHVFLLGYFRSAVELKKV